jgi:hypothetical protein
MFKGRRVGTLTAGIVLVIFGTMFLLNMMFPNINYYLIVSLWPIILVLLGIEIIVGYIINNEEKMKYDAGAIILVILLSVFSMGMAGAQFIILHFPQCKIIF